jgi:hypothetical protein
MLGHHALVSLAHGPFEEQAAQPYHALREYQSRFRERTDHLRQSRPPHQLARPWATGVKGTPPAPGGAGGMGPVSGNKGRDMVTSSERVETHAFVGPGIRLLGHGSLSSKAPCRRVLRRQHIGCTGVEKREH